MQLRGIDGGPIDGPHWSVKLISMSNTNRFDTEFESNGHHWGWTWSDEERTCGSLCCLDPIFTQETDNDGNTYDGTDCSQWPKDSELEVFVGKPVRFADAGDSPDYPEGLYTVVEVAS